MKEKLDRLNEAFVLSEAGDPQGMKEILRRLDELLQDAPSGRMMEAGATLGRALLDLIAGHVVDPARSWKTIEEGIAALQAIGDAASNAGPSLSAGDSDGMPRSDNASLPSSRSPAASPIPRELDAELLGGFILEVR